MGHLQCARSWHLGSINTSLLLMVNGSVHMIRTKFEIMTATKTIRYLFSQNKSLQSQHKWCIQNNLPLLNLRCSTSSHTSLPLISSSNKSNSMKHKRIKTQLKTYHNNNGNSRSPYNNNNNRSSSNSSIQQNDRKRTAKLLNKKGNQHHNMPKRCHLPSLIWLSRN